MSGFIRIIFIALGLLGLVSLLNWLFPSVLAVEGNRWQLVSSVAILAYLLTGLGAKKFNLSEAFFYAFSWIGIGLVLVAGYAFKSELSYIGTRMVQVLVPSYGIRSADKTVVIAKGEGGHFVILANVDGVAIEFLVDTGASRVTLSKRDAIRLGYDLENMKYPHKHYTANGVVMGASTRLGEVRIGSIRVKKVLASVTKGDMNQSLLGMTFLDRLKKYEIKGDLLTMVGREE